MKKVSFTTLLICSLVVFTYHHSLADDVALADDVTPAFNNPAQAGHAADLAEAFASEPNSYTEKAAQDVQDAEDALALVDPDDKVAIAKAEADLKTLEGILDGKISDLTGVTIDTIADMRSTMGWGQIAHEFGLQLGQAKRDRKNLATGFPDEFEMDEATKRDVKHGWAKGHGMTTSVASSGKKGLGLSQKDLGRGGKGAKSAKGNNGSFASSSKGSSAGGPSNGRGNSGNSSSGKSQSDLSSTGGPSNDKGNNGNNGNNKGNSGSNGNKGGNSGKSK